MSSSAPNFPRQLHSPSKTLEPGPFTQNYHELNFCQWLLWLRTNTDPSPAQISTNTDPKVSQDSLKCKSTNGY